MRTVTTGGLGIFLAMSFLISPSLAAGPSFTGAFQGTGRACNGALYIRTKTVSWLTPFSQCRKVPYEVIERNQKGDERRFAFHLKQRNQACLFDVLYLYHSDTPNPDIGWHVIGYATQEEYQADKQDGYTANSPRSQSCSLVTR